MATVEEAVNIVQSKRANIQACQIWYNSFRDNTLHKLTSYNSALGESLAQLKQFANFAYLQYPPPDLYVHLTVFDMEIRSSRFQYEQTLSEFLINDNQIGNATNSQFHIWLSEAVLLKECFTRQRLFNWPSSLPKVTLTEIEVAFETLVSALDHLWHCIQTTEQLLLEALTTLQNFQNHVPANTVNFDVSTFGVTPNIIYNLMVSILTKHSLVIDEQPMQMLKMGSFGSEDAKKRRGNVCMKTSLSLKLLHLNKNFSCFSPAQMVNLYVINAETARSIESDPNFSFNDITSNGVLRQKTNSQKGHLSVPLKCADENPRMMEASVPNWCISSVNRKSPEHVLKKGRNSRKNVNTRPSQIAPSSKTSRLAERPLNGGVTHEKFCILAVAPNMTFLPDGLCHNTWTMSAPIVVRSHSSHIGAALATLSWDNYFSNWTRLPFQIQEYGSWTQIQGVLVTHFNDWLGIDGTNSNDRTLEPHHLEYLKNKVIQHACVDNDENRISLKSFYNESMNGCGFSFWSWFHKVVILLKIDFFKNAWNLKHIEGFIDDAIADKHLSGIGTPVGTFIIKFSEHEKASMVFILAAHDENRNKMLIRTHVDFQNKNSSECYTEFMKHLDVHVSRKQGLQGEKTEKAFCFVYPDICVNEAFPQEDSDTKENFSESYARLITLLVIPQSSLLYINNDDRRRG